MKTITLRNWSGVLSIVSMLSAFVLIHYIIVPRHIVIGSFWTWMFATLAIQLVPDFVFAIAGLRCESRAGRISAIAASGLFLWLVWYAAVPVVSVFLQAAK